jgi:16S rRNA pseudouridine516 synthase
LKFTPSPTSLRLDKLLSQATGLPRSHTKGLVMNGVVQVDGMVVRDAGLNVNAAQQVQLDGAVLEWPRERYVMLHKPAGYVCSTEEPGHPLVAELIDTPWAAKLHSAGRLDLDTTGLLLLTSDGQWSHALTSPRRSCVKTYLVQAKHPLETTLVQRFAEGLVLRDDARPTLPAQLEILDSHSARVRISEGRYHQVKRMFAACGNRVEALHREAIGTLVLDPQLQPGEWRELSGHEVANV